MEILQFGKLAIKETESGLSFSDAESSRFRSELKTADVPLLIDFLKRHLENSANRRTSFRLDMTQLAPWDAARIEVNLQSLGAPVSCRVLDISLTGIFLELQHPLPDSVDSMPVDISFDGSHAILTGHVVRRQDGSGRIALHFPECMEPQGTVKPPRAYSDLFAELETMWLDSQLGLEWNDS